MFDFFKKRNNKQLNCKHDWFEVPIEVGIKSFSLISLLFGDVNKISYKTKAKICTKCKDEIIIEIT